MREPTTEINAALPATMPAKSDPVARRIRMREFQTGLAERMLAARSGSRTRAGQLGVLVGGERYLIDLAQTGEIATLGSITKVPLTQPWFLGITNIRGNLFSVADLAQFRGEAATGIDKQSRIIALATTLGLNAALLVSQVLGLRNLDDMTQIPHPQAGSVAAPHDWQRECYIDGDQTSWQLIDLQTIALDPQFLDVAA